MAASGSDQISRPELGATAPTATPVVDACLSICICTTGRAKQLRRCLQSIRAASTQVDIVVSDDGPPAAGCAEIAEAYGARYVIGPRSGISANRNAVIRASTRDFVMLLDDDAVLGPDALMALNSEIPGIPERTILTGFVVEPAGRVGLSSTSYLGFFCPYKGGPVENIGLNSNVFPTAAFREVGFDEAIEYGNEDMDLCARLVAYGYQIVFVPSLVNVHRPPELHLSRERERPVRRARFYVAIRRRAKWSRRPLSAVVYCIVAASHECASLILRRRNPLPALRDMWWAVTRAWRRRDTADIAISE